LTWPWYDL